MSTESNRILTFAPTFIIDFTTKSSTFVTPMIVFYFLCGKWPGHLNAFLARNASTHGTSAKHSSRAFFGKNECQATFSYFNTATYALRSWDRFTR